jgi:hypothetical protein
MCVCVNSYKNVRFHQERNQKFSVQHVKIFSAGCVTSIQSIRDYPSSTKQGANIITGMMTTFGERKFRRTLENFNRHSNYLLCYGIFYIYIYFIFICSIFWNTAATNITKYQIHVPGLYSWKGGTKECFSDDKIQKQEMPNKHVLNEISAIFESAALNDQTSRTSKCLDLCQNMVNLTVGFPIWRRPNIFIDLVMWNRTSDCEIL